MFESTLVDERSESHRPWTVAVSFLGQSLLVLVALLIPLLTTQSLPPGQWMSVLLAPPPPLGAPPAPPRAPQSVAVVAPAIFETDVLMAPATIPDKVALLVEDAAGPPRIDEDSSIGNTVGPIGSTIGVPSSLWSNSSSNRVPLPPPPPPPANPPKPATPTGGSGEYVDSKRQVDSQGRPGLSEHRQAGRSQRRREDRGDHRPRRNHQEAGGSQRPPTPDPVRHGRR